MHRILTLSHSSFRAASFIFSAEMQCEHNTWAYSYHCGYTNKTCDHLTLWKIFLYLTTACTLVLLHCGRIYFIRDSFNILVHKFMKFCYHTLVYHYSLVLNFILIYFFKWNNIFPQNRELFKLYLSLSLHTSQSKTEADLSWTCAQSSYSLRWPLQLASWRSVWQWGSRKVCWLARLSVQPPRQSSHCLRSLHTKIYMSYCACVQRLYIFP